MTPCTPHVEQVKGKGELSAIQSNELFEDIAIPDCELPPPCHPLCWRMSCEC